MVTNLLLYKNWLKFTTIFSFPNFQFSHKHTTHVYIVYIVCLPACNLTNWEYIRLSTTYCCELTLQWFLLCWESKQNIFFSIVPTMRFIWIKLHEGWHPGMIFFKYTKNMKFQWKIKLIAGITNKIYWYDMRTFFLLFIQTFKNKNKFKSLN